MCDTQPGIDVLTAWLETAPGQYLLAWEQSHGFLLLTDLGRQTMIEAIDRDNAQANLGLYLHAVDALVCWQCASRPDVLPAYDDALLRRELDLFPQWYLQQHRAITHT